VSLRLTLAFILALAVVALRLAVVGDGLPVLEPDAYEVAAAARAFSADSRASTGPGGPGEVALLALAFKTVGPSDALLVGVSAALFAAMVVAALWLGESVFGARIGIAAALLVGTFPTLVAAGYSGRAGFAGAPLLVAFVLLVRSPARPFGGGLALAAAGLAEPGLLFLVPAAGLLLITRSRPAPPDVIRRSLRDVSLLIFGAGVVLGAAASVGLLRRWPWPARGADLVEEALRLVVSESVAVRALLVVALLFPLAILTSPEGGDAARRLRQLAVLSVLCALAAGASGIGYSHVAALVPVLLVLVGEWIARAFASGPRSSLALVAGLACLATAVHVGPPPSAETRRLLRKLGRFVARASPSDATVLLDPSLSLSAPGLAWYSGRLVRDLDAATLAIGQMRGPTLVLVTLGSQPGLANDLDRAPEIVTHWRGSEWAEPVLLLRLH
jgi:hypothetical protein